MNYGGTLRDIGRLVQHKNNARNRKLPPVLVFSGLSPVFCLGRDYGSNRAGSVSSKQIIAVRVSFNLWGRGNLNIEGSSLAF